MKCFFILGRQHELCSDELKSMLAQNNISFSIITEENDFVVIESKDNLDPSLLMKKLAGTIKIGEVVGENIELNGELLINHLQAKEKKAFFGISSYNITLPINKIGQKLKKELKEAGISSRFVTSKANPLSSVIVEKNKLLKNGAEICILKSKETKFIGITRTVQPFEQFSAIDYCRPERDALAGMLPPKLAQMMINLSGVDSKAIIYDPFCGSGTVLQQALLLGFNNVIGSDISEKAIKSSQKNLVWLENKFGKKYNYKIFLADVRNLAHKMKPNSVDAIITESDLGPALRGREKIEELRATITRLTSLYRSALPQLEKILRKGGVIMIAVPEITLRAQIYKIYLQAILPSNLKIEKSWLYGRPGQLTQRRIYKIIKL